MSSTLITSTFLVKLTMSYQLICISPDGDCVREGTFNTKDEAWKRNNDMGSRWFFYPIRVLIATTKIVDVGDEWFELMGGSSFYLPQYKNRNLSTLISDLKVWAEDNYN